MPRASGTEHAADIVFLDGKIYPLEAKLPTNVVEAVAVKGEWIVFVGSRIDVEPYIGSQTEVVKLGSRVLLPAFTDAHVHLLDGGLLDLGCNLSGASNVDEALRRLGAYAENHPELPWVRAWKRRCV
jgi:predicted amidohydrolase YtcJ